ncbi:MAG: DUF805 domain-containing protein [Lentisphaerae bacterium]|nr:DUF805 domain-containing protein [Lentisphaerota bacterium]
MDFKAVIQNFVDVVTKKYFCFTGRTNRKDFWMFVLVSFVVSAVLGVIPGVGKILSAVWSLALLCPSLGITARRLHDTGKSGWMQLLLLIPVIGGLIVLLLCIPEGSKEANQYGEADAQ